METVGWGEAESCELSVCEESVGIRVGDVESVNAKPLQV